MTRPQINRNIYPSLALFSLMLVLVISICFLACVPPVSKDALVHHLAVPKMWLGHGGMYEIPALEYSYYPMTLDLLYIIPLYFGNDIVPKFIHFSFALATAGLIFGYLKRRLHIFYAMLGALFFLSIPIIVKLSITVYVDLGLVFFTTAGVMSVFKWRESNFRISYLFLAGLCCGLGLGIKYNGLVVLLLTTILVAYSISRAVSQGRYSTGQAACVLILFMALAGGAYAPWGIRNFIWTGNPIFPLFDGLFNGPDHFKLQSVPPLVLRKLMYNETWWETLLVPLRIFFQGQDDSHQYFDGKLNPALLLLPLFALVMAPKEGKAGKYRFDVVGMMIFSVVFVLFVFFQTNMRIRYMAPAIPFLVILSMYGFRHIVLLVTGHFSGKGRGIVSGIVLIAAVLIFSGNVIYIAQQFKIVTPFQFLGGDVSRDAYIERFRPEYPVIRHANASLPSDARILSLFIGRRGYYSDREMVFDIDGFQAFIKKSTSVEELSVKLAGWGVTHLLMRFDMFEQWAITHLDNGQRRLVSDFFNRELTFLFGKNGHGLYQFQSQAQ